jgi:hypothetical protein
MIDSTIYSNISSFIFFITTIHLDNCDIVLYTMYSPQDIRNLAYRY